MLKRIVLALLLAAGLVGGVDAASNSGRTWIQRCTGSRPFREHLRSVVIDGETYSDWLTHLASPCNSLAYNVGVVLESVLIEEGKLID